MKNTDDALPLPRTTSEGGAALADQAPRIGFVGIGEQGAPIAARIAKFRFPLTVYARRQEPLTPFREMPGVTVATSVAELASDVQALFLCVSTDTQVEEVLGEAFPNLTAGSIVVVHSTIHPSTCVRLAEQAAGHGVDFLDAPVSGGPEAAAQGRLTVMVGGRAELLAMMRPVLEAAADVIVHVGDVGAGATLKIVNNYLFAAQMSITADLVALLGALDLDLNAALQAIARSSGSTLAIESFARRGTIYPLHPKGYAYGVGTLAKDVGLMRDIIRNSPARELSLRLFETADAGLQAIADARPGR